jgi:hypothetical protein
MQRGRFIPPNFNYKIVTNFEICKFVLTLAKSDISKFFCKLAVEFWQNGAKHIAPLRRWGCYHNTTLHFFHNLRNRPK